MVRKLQSSQFNRGRSLVHQQSSKRMQFQALPSSLPTPDDIFSKLAGGKIFNVINLLDAYLQVEVGDETKKFLTIKTRGLFQFNRLAPGVKSAPPINSADFWTTCSRKTVSSFEVNSAARKLSSIPRKYSKPLCF